MSRYLTPATIVGAMLGWLLAIAGGDVAALADAMSLCKTAFLGALKLIIGPLVFLSLVSGLLSLENVKRFRSMGLTTIGYYLLTTGIAIGLGLGIVYFLHPWRGGPHIELNALPAPGVLIDLQAASFGAVLSGLARTALVNPIAAFMNLNILGIVTNALLFGIAALFALPSDSRIPAAVHDLTAVVYRITGWIVYLLPIGILGITYELAGSITSQLLQQLFDFALVVVLATLGHGLIVLPLIAWLTTRIPPWRLWRAILHPLVVAFTTSSSAATLPVSMQAARTNLGVSAAVAGFVLPLGAQMNMDGTALFEGIAAVFLANLFGIELGAAGTATVFIMAMVSSIGAPGVPSASMAGMQMVMLAVGIPLEALGLLLLIERPLDTVRTAVNVEGDLIGCVVVEHRHRGIA
jgi:Na+/H+-dicarboxylate symporter